MSGSTIGGLIGAGIGWALAPATGGASLYIQAGFMAGSMIGAYADPQRFETPRINDFSLQSSQDGIPRVYGWGTYPVEQTWLMWRSDVRHVRKKKSGKGSSSEQITNTYLLSYAIACGRGGISGFKLIEEDGKIVFDARTDAELGELGYTAAQISETRAAQAKFLQNATFYYGTPDQMPDPTMVAVEGAGNVPAYRDTAFFVVKDKDITARRSIPNYRVVAANCGDVHDEGGLPATLLVTGAGGAAPFFARCEAVETPVFSTIEASTGANLNNSKPGYYDGIWLTVAPSGSRYSTDGLLSWQTGTTPFGGSDTPYSLAVGPAGWLVSNFNEAKEAARAVDPPSAFALFEYEIARDGIAYPVFADDSFGMCRFTGGYYYAVPNQYPGFLIRNAALEGVWEGMFLRGDDGDPNGNTISAFYDVCQFEGALYATVNFRPTTNHKTQLRRSMDGGLTWPEVLVDIPRGQADAPWQIEAGGGVLIVLAWGSRYVWTSEDGFTAPHETGLATIKTSFQEDETRGRDIVFAAGRFFMISGNAPGAEAAKGNKITSTLDGISFSPLVSIPLSDTQGIAAGGDEAPAGYVEVPDAPGHFIDSATGEFFGPAGVTIEPCLPTLGEIVADKCESRSVPRDVSELPDPVTGYRVAGPSTAQRIIQGLQPGFFFGASEFDGLLHFPKRGRELTFALTEDDFVERDGDPIQWERMQEPELLKKLTLRYIDPSVNYTDTTQMAERRAATISAEGESAMELGITGSKDWAAQVTDKSIKVAWGEPDTATVWVTIARSDLVPCAEGTVPYLDGSTVVARIERIEDEGLVRMLHLRRTRANLYESNASGAAKPLPAFPGSDIRGPTDGLVLNIPVLLDANDVPGIHWAAAGFTSAWAGGQFQILRAGEWGVAGETTFAANTGTLLSALPYHAGDFDSAHVLHVRMGDDLESVIYAQLLQERNPMAILREDGTAEIVQFQTATEVAPGEFELSGLLRNRMDTGASAHAAGARVVLLDEAVGYATLQPTDIGQVLPYRFVSLGTDPDAASIQTIDLTTMESQREWPVAELAVAVDGDDFILTWQPRHRLGSDVFPVRSSHWAGYQVGWDDGVDSHSEVINTETITFTLPGATDITFSVAQLNQFSGAGPAETVHIP